MALCPRSFRAFQRISQLIPPQHHIPFIPLSITTTTTTRRCYRGARAKFPGRRDAFELRDREESASTALMLQERFNRHWKVLYISARKNNVVSRDISSDKFHDWGSRLLLEVFTSSPTAQAARRITDDFEGLFEVGIALSVLDRQIQAWTTTATAAAGAITPLLVLARRHLDLVPYPTGTPTLDRVETLALKYGDPRAIMVHCKVLMQRKQFKEASKLLQTILDRTYPTRLRPRFRDDVTLNGAVDPPWRMHAQLCEIQGKTDDTDEMLRIGALEYQDPSALIDYAYVQQKAGNMATYEECMTKAATSGHPEACHKLGNFYYLTSQGRIPTREEETESSSSSFSLKRYISKLFGQSRTREDYRRLAMDWYELSFLHGSHNATLKLVLLLREDGDMDAARKYLDHMEASKIYPKFVTRLKENWEDKDYRPAIPDKLLEL